MADQGMPPMSPEQLASIQYQMENLDDDRRPVILGASWALWGLALIALGLRFYAQRMVRNGFKPEDGLILLAIFGATGLVINATVGTYFGGGRHVVLAGENGIITTIKLVLAFEIIYFFTLVCIKTSILTFFYRTFGPNRPFRIAVYGVVALVIGLYISSTLVAIFQCKPISFFWNKNQPGTCIDVDAFILITSIINVITDFIVVVMPMPIIWKLDMPKSRKIAICGIFLLGGIVIFASVIRLVYLHNLITFDPTYDTVNIGIWSAVEPNLGIVGACLPLMAPIFRKVKEMSTKKSYGGSNESGWNHARLEENQKGPTHEEWTKNSSDSSPGPYVKEDDAPLVRHDDWVVALPENAIRVKHVFEMQTLPKRPTSHDLALR